MTFTGADNKSFHIGYTNESTYCHVSVYVWPSLSTRTPTSTARQLVQRLPLCKCNYRHMEPPFSRLAAEYLAFLEKRHLEKKLKGEYCR